MKITIPDPSNIFARPELFVNCSAFLGRHFLFVFSSLKVDCFILFQCRFAFIEKRATKTDIDIEFWRPGEKNNDFDDCENKGIDEPCLYS